MDMEQKENTNIIKKIAYKLGKTGFFHVFGSTTINKIIGFAGAIFLVKIISKAEYGVFSYADNLLNFFTIAAGLGAVSGMLQMCSENRDETEKRQIYEYASRWSFFINVALGIIILLVSVFVPLKIEGANLCLGIMAFLPLFQYVYEMQSFYLRTQLRNKDYATSNTFSTLVIFILTCTLSWVFQVKGLVAAKYIAFAVSALFILFRYRVNYPVAKKSELSDDVKKQFWGISTISMCNNGLSNLMNLLGIFVLGIVIPDSTVVASYKVATTIPTALAFVPAAFVTYIYPYFARKREDKEWVKKKYVLVSLALGACAFLISFVLIVFAPFIIKLLFGEAYLDAVPCFRILSLNFAIASVFRTLPGNILVTQRKLKFNLFVAALSGIINTVLNVIFISKWQSIGAAYSTLITVVVTSILNMAYLTYILNKKSE